MPSVLEAGVLVGALWPLLAYSSWTADPYSPVKLAGLALGVLAAWGALLRGAPRTPLDRPLAAAACVAVASAAASVDLRLSLFGHPGSYSEGLLGQGLCALLLLAAAAQGPDARRRLLRALAASGALIGTIAVLQLAGFDPLPGDQPPRAWGIRPTSFHGAPVYAGAVLAVTLPAALAAALEESGRRRLLWACAALLTAAGAVATLSRAAVLASAAGAVATWLAHEGLTPRARKAFLGIGAAGALAFVAAMLMRPTWRSDAARFETWRIAARAAAARPLSGWGPDTFGLAFRRLRDRRIVGLLGDGSGQDNAHNDVLQAAATKGLPGTAALLWLWAAAAALALRRAGDPGRSSEAAASGGALAALFVEAKFEPTPLAALGAVAAQVGALCADDGPRSPRRALLAAGATAGLLLAGRVVGSERVLQVAGWHAARAEHRDAATALSLAADSEAGLVARTQQSRYLVSLAMSAQDGPTRAAAFQSAVRAADQAILQHPADPAAYHMRSFVLLSVRKAGGPDLLDKADADAAAAARLDPWFRPIARTRLAIAEARADRPTTELARADLERIEAAIHGTAPR